MPERIRASLGKLILASSGRLAFTCASGAVRESTRIDHNNVPVNTNAGYGRPVSATCTSLELLRNSHTAVVVSGLIRAHRMPSALWRYWALMSRVASRQANSRPAQRSWLISVQSLAGCASGLSGV